uniref:Uncharacterized protein n=1 Tax=Cucumis melo TaxID=3656 RepID=A0A9I9E502_CUCME
MRQRGGSEMRPLRTAVRWHCEEDDVGRRRRLGRRAAVCRNEEKWRSVERGMVGYRVKKKKKKRNRGGGAQGLRISF